MPRIHNAFGLASLATPHGLVAFDTRTGCADVTAEQADFLLRLPGYGLADDPTPAAAPAPAPEAVPAPAELAPEEVEAANEAEEEPAPEAEAAPEAPAKVTRKRRGR